MNKKEIAASTTIVETIKIVSNEHLNPNKTLFGGYLMCWIDEIAFLCARRYSGKKSCVTVGIENVSFKLSQQLGDHVHLSAQIVHVGKSSMVIDVQVESEDVSTNSRAISNRARLTFVCLDDKNKPIQVPKLILDSPESQMKYKEVELRNKVKKRLENHLESHSFSLLKINSGYSPLHKNKSAVKKLPRMARAHFLLVKNIESMGVTLPDVGAKALLDI